ncbi:MAG TPA: HEPN domain-containing protein [bacterium]
MHDETNFSGSAEEWLRFAQSDLEIARIEPPPAVMLEGLCFHAQQAAEKAIKAVLIANSKPFPKTHNISTLLDLLPDNLNIPDEVQEATILTDYSVMTRYPGAIEPVEEDEYWHAIHLAAAVVSWAQKLLANKFDDSRELNAEDKEV